MSLALCTKAGYSTKKAATTYLNARMKSHGRGRPDYLRAYPCPDCNKWHLTHKRSIPTGDRKKS